MSFSCPFKAYSHSASDCLYKSLRATHCAVHAIFTETQPFVSRIMFINAIAGIVTAFGGYEKQKLQASMEFEKWVVVYILFKYI